jgi:hypothetical protein
MIPSRADLSFSLQGAQLNTAKEEKHYESIPKKVFVYQW